jgi:sporulation protein YlmC with PRC-barrel domain
VIFLTAIETKTVFKARHIGVVTDVGLSFHANWVRLALVQPENVFVLFEAEADEGSEADILIQTKDNTAYILLRSPELVGLRVIRFDVLDIAEQREGEAKNEA